MPEIKISLPHPHKNQLPIINNPARFKVLACGRRFGKTETALLILTIRGVSGQKVAYFAPTYKMTMEFFRQVIGHAGKAVKAANRNEGRIEFVGGGSLDFWSLSASSAETVRGRKYHFVVIDEAAMIVNGGVIWNEVIRPMLMDYRGGALFLSTPRGRNWFFDLYTLGQDPLNTEYASWRHASYDNPFMPYEEVESARSTTPMRSFQQEYLAEFLEDAGMVFRGMDKIALLDTQPVLPGRVYYGGIDWAKDYDFTVISIFDAETKEQVYLDRFNEIGWTFQRERIKTAAMKYPGCTFYVEMNSIGDPNYEELKKDPDLNLRPFWTTGQTKSPLIESMALAIERLEVKLLKDEVQKLEFQSYSMERNRNGSYSYNAPTGLHDDCVMATSIAWYGVRNGLADTMGYREVEIDWS